MVDDLVHVYDAAKQHEYYLRTRQLKGRKTGSAKAPGSRQRSTSKPPTKTRAQRQAERRKRLEVQVEALKSRLERLREILAQEVKKAQARSGATSKKPPAKNTSQQKTSGKTQKLTSQQKAAKAKADKKYREENRDKILADQVESLTKKIKTIQERITKMRKNNSVGVRRTTSN